MGRITRDAEMKTTASGKSFVRFSIAVNRTRKQGEKRSSTEIVIDKLNLAGWRRDVGTALPEVTPIEDAIPDEISLLDELRDHPDFDLY